MSKPITKTVANNVDEALEDVMHELKRAARDVGGDIEDSIAKASDALNRAAHALADEARDRSVTLVQATADEAKRHPVATAAAIATAAAALVGLVVAARRAKTS